MSSHSKLKDEHKVLRKKYDGLKVAYQKAVHRAEEGAGGVVELREKLNAECRLVDDLRAQLARKPPGSETEKGTRV